MSKYSTLVLLCSIILTELPAAFLGGGGGVFSQSESKPDFHIGKSKDRIDHSHTGTRKPPAYLLMVNPGYNISPEMLVSKLEFRVELVPRMGLSP